MDRPSVSTSGGHSVGGAVAGAADFVADDVDAAVVGVLFDASSLLTRLVSAFQDAADVHSRHLYHRQRFVHVFKLG